MAEGEEEGLLGRLVEVVFAYFLALAVGMMRNTHKAQATAKQEQDRERGRYIK